jgi:hypothetical protein
MDDDDDDDNEDADDDEGDGWSRFASRVFYGGGIIIPAGSATSSFQIFESAPT